MRSALLLSLVFLLSCGSDESVASKSAAAFRDAKAKGINVGGGHEHGGHVAETPASDPHAGHASAAPAASPATDHSQHTASAADAHTGHRGGAPARSPAMTDHSQHNAPPRRDAHAGHATGAPAPSPAITDHSQHAASSAGDPHAGHTSRAPAPSPTQSTPSDHSQHTAAAPHTAHTEDSSIDTRRVDPPSTLTADSFDRAVPASVREAAKAAGGDQQNHRSHDHSTNPKN